MVHTSLRCCIMLLYHTVVPFKVLVIKNNNSTPTYEAPYNAAGVVCARAPVKTTYYTLKLYSHRCDSNLQPFIACQICC